MGYSGQPSKRHRILALALALCVVIGIGVGLVKGLDLRVIKQVSEAISALAIAAPESPPVAPEAGDEQTDTPSPANRHAKAAPVSAPKPKIIPPQSPPVAAAPRPDTGNMTSAGASPHAGPGSGAGGSGDGRGAGGSKAVWRSGEIRNRDYPKEASRARVGGVVEVRFTIRPNGRVTGCRVTRSSGDTALDTTTCRLIEQRFHFKPATNAAGETIASDYGWRQTWWLEGLR